MGENMARNRSRIKTKRRLIFLVSTSLVIVFTLLFTIGGYWVDIISKYKEKQVLEQQLVDLKNEEAVLKVDVEKLQDSDYIARYAREKYLYSKEGEFIIKIPE